MSINDINNQKKPLSPNTGFPSRVHSLNTAVFKQRILRSHYNNRNNNGNDNLNANGDNCRSDPGQSLPVIIKLDPYSNYNQRLNRGSEAVSLKNAYSFTHKLQSKQRHCISNTPIALYDHNQSKSNFHDTFNRNFYNTKYVYSAMKSDIYQNKTKEESELMKMTQGRLCVNTVLSPWKLIKKRDASSLSSQSLERNTLDLNRNIRERIRSQLNEQHNNQHGFIDCNSSINNTTTVQAPQEPSMIFTSKVFKKQSHYPLVKQSAQSKAGKDYNGATKINQDSYLIKDIKIPNGTVINLLGVFDGHGLNGHKISRNIKGFFSNLEFNSNISSSQIGKLSYENLKCLNHSQLFNDKSYTFILKLFSALSTYINNNKAVDAKLSGSTCIMLFHSNNKLICANCGDSRSIIIQENGTVIQLSRDHKPNLPDERNRIEDNGGRVEKVQSYYGEGPYRVWLRNENYPGLAMSRSIGDIIAHSIGVSAEPEIKEYDLNDIKPKIMVTGSDGLWEFMSNEKISGIVLPYYHKGDCEGASKRLIEEAQKSWENESICIVDDITVLVSFF